MREHDAHPPDTFFFSIVIPAHNEEKYIGDTLASLYRLEYPRDAFEIIVVENGSSDRTQEVTRAHLHDGDQLITSAKGVSRARNAGVRAVSQESDWIVFLDADVLTKPTFLTDLNAFLHTREARDSVGCVVSTWPHGRTDPFAQSVFFTYNSFGKRLLSIPGGVFLVRTHLRHAVSFIEHISRHEDIKFLQDVRKHGRVLFFDTHTVSTSTRRFDRMGWSSYILQTWWHGLFLTHLTGGNDEYPVIR